MTFGLKRLCIKHEWKDFQFQKPHLDMFFQLQ